MQLILDIGSGRSLPDVDTAIKLIDEVIKRDTKKHTVIFKTQLFESAPPNVPLNEEVFVAAFHYAKNEGYHLTSSVFDENSLRLLLAFDWPDWELPFIKIACRPDLYWLIGEIPRRVPVYVSTENVQYYVTNDIGEQSFLVMTDDVLLCVREYPAKVEDYKISNLVAPHGVSDHTAGWELFKSVETKRIWEKHVILEHNDTNPDAGAFACTVDELSEVL